VYVLAGQSNMVGRGVPSELPEALVAQVAERAHICYDHDQNFAEVAEGLPRAASTWKPLERNAQHSQRDGGCHHFGPEFSLAKALLGSTEGSVYLAKFAMGSTNLHTDWNPGGKYFRNFVDFVKAALASAPQPARLCGVFWLQGESDSGGKAAEVNGYEQNLVNFFAELRRELAAPRLAVVASQLDFHYGSAGGSTGKRPKKLDRINKAILAACAREEMQPAECSVLDGYLSTHDDGHLDSAALLQVGSNMGTAYERLMQRSRTVTPAAHQTVQSA